MASRSTEYIFGSIKFELHGARIARQITKNETDKRDVSETRESSRHVKPSSLLMSACPSISPATVRAHVLCRALLEKESSFSRLVSNSKRSEVQVPTGPLKFSKPLRSHQPILKMIGQQTSRDVMSL